MLLTPWHHQGYAQCSSSNQPARVRHWHAGTQASSQAPRSPLRMPLPPNLKLVWSWAGNLPSFFNYETYEQVQCDMQCGVMPSVTRNAEPHKKKNKWMSRPHQVIERGPCCTIVVQAFRVLLTGARAPPRQETPCLPLAIRVRSWYRLGGNSQPHVCALAVHAVLDPWTLHDVEMTHQPPISQCYSTCCPLLQRAGGTRVLLAGQPQSLLASHRLKFGCCAQPLEHVG